MTNVGDPLMRTRACVAALLLTSAFVLSSCGKPERGPVVDTVQLPGAPQTAPTPAPGKAAVATAPTQAPAPAFSYAAGTDLYGYYMPTTELRFGNLRLSNLAIGQPADFAAWEKGARSQTFAPVMLQFEDMSTPERTNELGQTYHDGFRVLPATYTIDGAQVRFTGEHPRLGHVVFTGRLDAAARAGSQALGPSGDQKPVLKGALSIGALTVDPVEFSWFGGD